MNITKILKERTPSSDHEKIVQALEICANLGNCRTCPYYSEDATVPCIHYVMYDALILLKSKEPREPVMVNGEPECGACRYELRPDADSYCPCCGRAVKWE